MKRIEHLLLEFLYFLSKFTIRKRNLVLFGGWFGQRVDDNSMYLLRDFLKYKSNCKYVWIGNKNIKQQVSDVFGSQVEYCAKGSLKSLYYQLHAKYVFVCQGYLDIAKINLMGGAELVQLWHGFPVKKIVDDMKGSRTNYNYQHYNYFLSTSSLMTDRICSAFKSWGANRNNIIGCLQPRNQEFSSSSDLKVIKKQLNIDDTQKIALYLPTFRDSGEKSFDFHNLSETLKEDLRRENIMIIQKKHFAEGQVREEQESGIIDISPEMNCNTQVLMRLADILVSDYSSAYVDFLLLDRPIIHFLYDYTQYTEYDRGIYTENFEDEAGGEIVTSDIKLISAIVKCCRGNESKNMVLKRRRLNTKLNEYRNIDPVEAIFSKMPAFMDNFAGYRETDK